MATTAPAPAQQGRETKNDPVDVSGGAVASSQKADSAPALREACDAELSAMLARFERCKKRLWPMPGGLAERDREVFVAACVDRAGNKGTGYTAGFHQACTKAINDAGCHEEPGVIAACWPPKGALSRGQRCAADDQCSDGYCALPEGAKPGTSCGTCDVPVWKERHQGCERANDRCSPGLLCTVNYPSKGDCFPVDDQLGVSEGDLVREWDGHSIHLTMCEDGLHQDEDGRCTSSPTPVGTACSNFEQCSADQSCNNGRCVLRAGIGEACELWGEKKPRCREYLTCNGVGRCELKKPLVCD